MGFHPLDIIVVVGIALLLFGPKTLQSLSRTAGRGMGHARDAKDKLMAELPVEEFSKVTGTLAQIPTSPQQVAHKLVASSLKSGEKAEQEAAEQPAQKQE